MERTFDTPEPVHLYVEIASGTLTIEATDTTTTHVQVTGEEADDVTVAQDGGQISIIAQRRSGFLGRRDGHLHVSVALPTSSALATKTGSADQTATGIFGVVRAKSGSGEIRIDVAGGTTAIDTGSGDVTVAEARGDLRCKCGSGDVRIGLAQGMTAISTGSGDIEVARAEANLATKTGSGNIRVGRTGADLATSTASGDVAIDLFEAGGLVTRTASGDVRVGVPSGIPVWTDVSTVSGRVRSNLEGAGQPKDGEPYLELRVTTVSGDIVLDQR
ncbi:DUF4097 and DUF4098 domain-containing protein YvlB [Nocardioides daedukensis]|uniref:DUF4097 and DUF4098 domain-containing protein YvlB n=1 Tax=Nocardioides daedukensis TaxID=634462 RepID=A0A7Y9S2A6_9ACTN|nr:DUF4097 family beta strand repeat-containing protein [Nocardioides daedukensis]NYG59177.1 DUF4097 and DUF4098 domain-containing protein YvlB [Nocardioides daedukensis]